MPSEQSAVNLNKPEVSNETTSDFKKDIDSDEGCDVLEEILNLNAESVQPLQKQGCTITQSNEMNKDHNKGISDKRTDHTTVREESKGNENVSTMKTHLAASHVNVQKQEEELDFLLSLDTPVKHCTTDNNLVDSGERFCLNF